MKPLVLIFLVVFSISSIVARPQTATVASGKCSGKIYSPKEVTRQAKLTTPLAIKITEEARSHALNGRIEIEAVMCRDGRVTDVRVIKGLPWGMTENAVLVVSNLSFTPAELNLHSVSQWMQFEFIINETSGVPIGDSRAAAGRLVEEIDIVGNRRLTGEQIRSWIKTRPGDKFDPDQVERDLQTMLRTGFFDGVSTRVAMEDAIRGGVRVIFEVKELPLIKQIKFEGVKEADQPKIHDQFAREDIKIRIGAPFDPVEAKKATRLIEQFLARSGWVNAKAEAFVENLSATEVGITFRISERDF